MRDDELELNFSEEPVRYEIWASGDDASGNSIYARMLSGPYDIPEDAVGEAVRRISRGDIPLDEFSAMSGVVSLSITVDEMIDCEGESMNVGSIFLERIDLEK